jgi:hypothetical protein
MALLAAVHSRVELDALGCFIDVLDDDGFGSSEKYVEEVANSPTPFEAVAELRGLATGTRTHSVLNLLIGLIALFAVPSYETKRIRPLRGNTDLNPFAVEHSSNLEFTSKRLDVALER